MDAGNEPGNEGKLPGGLSDAPRGRARSADWLVGGGGLGELIRATDWSCSPLGPRDHWPQSLRTAVNLVLASKFPAALLWGRELLLLYNDAYRVIAAEKHPLALGRSTREIWAEVWHINEPIFAAVMARGETLYFEDKPFRINRTGQDEDAYFTLCYSPVHVEDGSVGGALVILEETTARLQLEQELRRTTTDLEEAQAVARIGCWRFVRATRAISWSKELFRIFDVEEGEFRASHDSFLARVHPEDRARVHLANREATDRGAPFIIEYRILTRNGEKWIREVGSATKALDGSVEALFGTAQDVTEQRRAEQLLRESQARQAFLLSLSDELQAIQDPTEQQRTACMLVGKHFGADRVHYGEHHDDEGFVLVPPDFFREGCSRLSGRYELAAFGEVPPWLRSGRTAVIADTETAPELTEVARATFRRLETRAFISAPLVRRGKLAWTLSVASNTPRDWTRDEVALVEEVGNRTWSAVERARAEAALREANLQLAEADRRKTAFLGVLSHELRNPLAPITNSLFILDHALPGGAQAGRAKAVIGRQVARLSHLVNELLEVTRLTCNKLHLHKERFDLNEIAGRSVEDNRTLFEHVDVRLELVPAPEQVFVLADRTRIAQSVGNLLQNAAKFTPAGGSTLVSVETLAGYAVLRVKDTGIGMDVVTSLRVFDPFVQANEALDRGEGGLGIGLAVVKGLVELHGGTVGAHSDGPGKGSEFVVRLPLDVGDEAGQEPDSSRQDARHMKRRVLVIEDNVDAADTLRKALERYAHEVQVARGGPEGIAKARALKPDVLLCDLGLPGMDGFEVARAFRADDLLESVFLVALSGYASPEDLQRAAEAGFELHLAKPVAIEKLEEVLRMVPAR